MFPWLFVWMPQFYWPLSGSVEQRIAPQFKQFFDAIPQQAGNGEMERKIFETASYGRQLGILIEALVHHLELAGPERPELQDAPQRLAELYRAIEQTKRDNAADLAKESLNLMRKLQQLDPDAFARTLHRLQVDQAPPPP